jgi:zinc transport system substrate-binding protein
MPFEVPLAGRAAALNPSLAVAAMDAGIAKRGAPAHGHDHDHGAPGHVCGGAGGDPHIWLAPRLMCAMASNTVAALERVLPALRPGLAERLAATVAEIRATDAAVRERWRGCGRAHGWCIIRRGPISRRVTDSCCWRSRGRQDAFGAASGGGDPAGAEAGVRAVFTEPQYDRRPVTTLARQVGARLEVIDPLAEAWPELMRDVAAKLAAGDAP